MARTAKATIEITTWDESEIDPAEGTDKLTRAHVVKTYSGDIEARSVTEWLMAYAADGSATFLGLERLTGTVAGRAGTLVLEHQGGFEDGAATATVTVVSGTDELSGATGTGTFVAAPAPSLTLVLD